MFNKFALITGILNFPFGLGMIIHALLDPQSESIVNTVVLGAFILFAGAVLIWATQDLGSRAPVIVWGGLVRLVAVAIVAYALTIGTVAIYQVVTAGMDLIVGMIYLLGSSKCTGTSIARLITGRANCSQ